jgi:acetyl esterase/lipase
VNTTRFRLSLCRRSLALWPVLTCLSCSGTTEPADTAPPSVLLDVAYGSDARNVLDFWRADRPDPTPLAVFIHGGGFIGGAKENILPARRDSLLSAGISVASINYRLATTAPMPAQQHDAARAIQFLRSMAGEWGLDGSQVCAWGTSGGGALSMWLGTHDDLADPSAADPVARESTRLTCIAPIEAQSTFDRDWMQTWIGGNLHMHPSFPLWFGVEDYDALETPAVLAVIEEVSALEHVTPGDSPAYMVYYQPNVRLPDDANPRDGGHHPAFGVKLKEALDAVGVEAIVVIQGRATSPDPYGSVVGFMVGRLK